MRAPMISLCVLLAACDGTSPTPAASTAVAASEAKPMPAPGTPAPVRDPVPAPTAAVAGAITGTLGYPGEALPAMRVCAFELAEGAPHCIETEPAQRQYRIDGVPQGDYQVLAYPREGSGAPGGYTGCVDDLDARCTAHDLRVVVVAPGETTHGIDPVDFYAGDAGVDWPAEP